MGERERIAHLLRRATFGPTAEEVDAGRQAGYLTTVFRLAGPPGPSTGLAPPALPADPILALRGKETQAEKDTAFFASRALHDVLIDWWLDKMVANGHQMEEKLTFFWHGHWATSLEKVNSAALMLQQNNAFRAHGRGSFAGLAKAMVRDPALILWLDGNLNTRQAPNENLARELMELFVLGIGGYSEADVREGARALTGWMVDGITGRTWHEPTRFDSGAKSILNQSAKFQADSLVDLLVSQPSSARFLAGRFWFRFASGKPVPQDTMDRLVSAYAQGNDISALLQALFTDPAFEQAVGQLVKQPVEWLVGALRQLRLRPSQLKPDDRRKLVNQLWGLDQVPFRPRNVGGWPSGQLWLTSQSAQIKLVLADMLAGKVSETTLANIKEVPAPQRSRELARLLVVDDWTPRTKAVLDRFTGDVRKMLAMGLISPEYSVH